MIVRNVWRKRFPELKHLETSTADDKAAVLGHCSDARDVVESCHLESLLASPVLDVPHFHDALRVCRNKSVLTADAVHSY